MPFTAHRTVPFTAHRIVPFTAHRTVPFTAHRTVPHPQSFYEGTRRHIPESSIRQHLRQFLHDEAFWRTIIAKCCLLLSGKRNYRDIVRLVCVRHCYMFRLSTSGWALVHKKGKGGERRVVTNNKCTVSVQ